MIVLTASYLNLDSFDVFYCHFVVFYVVRAFYYIKLRCCVVLEYWISFGGHVRGLVYWLGVLFRINRYPAPGPHMDRSRAKNRALSTMLTKSRDLQQHWCTRAHHCVTNPGLVFEPRAPTQGEPCASWVVCLLGFKPRTGWYNSSLILPLLLAVLAREILEPPTMGIAAANRHLLRLFFCDSGK